MPAPLEAVADFGEGPAGGEEKKGDDDVEEIKHMGTHSLAFESNGKAIKKA